MKTRKSQVWTAWLAAAFFAAAAGGMVWAADASAGAPEAGAELDWRAFLAPFHSVFLHLPIGFVTIALLLEIYSLFHRGKSLRQAIGFVLWISVLSAIVVALLGYLRAEGGGYEKQALTFHQWTGIAVTALTGFVAFLHLLAFPRASKRRLFFASIYRLMLLVNVGLIAIAGHYGGNLTHGSKYLFENAPEWVGALVENTEAKVTEKIAEETGLELAPEPAIETATGSGVYGEVLRPVFEAKCYQCHGPEKQKGGYRMDTIEGLFAQGDSELDPIVTGRPLESYLVEVITLPVDDDLVMPPEGKEQLTPEETLAVMRWVWDGAETGVEETDVDETVAERSYVEESGAKESGAKESGAKESDAEESDAEESGAKESGVEESGVEESDAEDASDQ